MRDWWEEETTKGDTASFTWGDILEHRTLIALDLHATYGIDTESGILEQRSWPWLETRITDLITQPTRLRRALGLPDISKL